ncbi:alpha-glucuronidase family glycosyl hydrolase [Paenibacillus macerans]|uniref:alpha-glucuronidase family glycosyl hydrolase n=1 Tax=Paenibacillus macerans TaxID=44252 RepID=UPI00203AA8DC|nr:alpha-glucuronidase family glycosyl hydrolase [Paenibacillus macerans]MCM3700555.1 alpha-glucuronidase [Paenibacillus macerans]
MQRLSNHSEVYKCWLRYAAVTDPAKLQEYRKWCGELVSPAAAGVVFESAVEELQQGIFSMIGMGPQNSPSPSASHYILLGTRGQSKAIDEALFSLSATSADSYILKSLSLDGRKCLLVAGRSDRGTLYAAFHLLRLMQMGSTLEDLDIQESPVNGLRMINQWDNMDGSIERGYAGQSIFYENNRIVSDLSRIKDYARLLSSTGINAISINNVNVHHHETLLITQPQLSEVARVAGVFRKYGIATFLSINFASPMQVGDLTTADPLDEEVRAWWRNAVEEIYRVIPDFGGFLVKADSESRPGPFTYGRNHIDGANMLAEALVPFGGTVIWRCFVYNCQQDWRDRSTDRARAAYDHFTPFDGGFHDNVILQIKNGPMDFQVREPVSPLFGALPSTNQVLELQIAQEYTGQARHVCYLVPQWKEVLEFDTFAHGEGSDVAKVVSGSLFGGKLGGIAAVSNIGNNANWTGHVLAQANLYGFGRLSWNPELTSEQIAREWIYLTFGTEPKLVEVILNILLNSWQTYENYTAPLGVGWMVNPDHHYGPNVDGYEYSRWGTYHFADRDGIGVDRTVKSGTGYAAQYHKPHADRYESLDTCPDELLLFFHHVPYTHKLHSGKTVIQHIYDTHFAGAEQAMDFLESWLTLEGSMDAQQFENVRSRLQEQAQHALEWRDQINTYFFRKSGIADEHGRTIY